MRKAVAGALAGALLYSGLPAMGAPLPAELEACVALRRDVERLLCYDKAVAQIRSGAEGTPALSAANMFGANRDLLDSRPAPNPSGSEPQVKREELRQISGSVTSLQRGGDGMIRIELDNGQVWRQQDADARLFVAVGDEVTIVRAAMGTFRLTDKTGRFARFKRVR